MAYKSQETDLQKLGELTVADLNVEMWISLGLKLTFHPYMAN